METIRELVKAAEYKGLDAETLEEWAAVLGYHGRLDSLPSDVFEKLSEALANYVPPDDPDDYPDPDGEKPAEEPQEAAGDAEPASEASDTGEALFAPQEAEEEPKNTAPRRATVTAPQLTRLGALWSEAERLGVDESSLRSDLEGFAGVKSKKELSKTQASDYIGHLADKVEKLRKASAS